MVEESEEMIEEKRREEKESRRELWIQPELIAGDLMVRTGYYLRVRYHDPKGNSSYSTLGGWQDDLQFKDVEKMLFAYKILDWLLGLLEKENITLIKRLTDEELKERYGEEE